MKKKKKGFTLLEMIIAVGILSMMSVSILKVFLVSKDLNEKAYDLDNSVRLTKNIIALLDDGVKPGQNKGTLQGQDLISEMNKGASEGEYILYLDHGFAPLNQTEKEKAYYTFQMTLEKNISLSQSEEPFRNGLYNLEVQIWRDKPYLIKKAAKEPIYKLSAKRLLFEQGGRP